jgi:kynurenine formamidase
MRVFELSHVLERGMPQYFALPPFQHAMLNRLGDAVRGDVTVASDLVIASPHTGTHIDALSHVAHYDGGVEERDRAAADALPLFLTRGVVVDARDAGSEIGPEAFEGLDLRRGDVVLVATGWEELWSRPAEFSSPAAKPPGITLEAARSLVAAGVAAIGADTPILESPASALHVHEYLLDQAGVYIIENMALAELLAAGVSEFLFVALPLRIKGGTGSPLRPIAIVGGEGELPPFVFPEHLNLA